MVNLKIKKHIFKNGRLFGWGVSPNNDWKILFVVFVLMIVSVSILGVYMFIGIANGKLFLVEQKTLPEVKKYDNNLAQKTLSGFSLKSKNLDNIKKNQTEVVDPSL